ncbi:FtsJ-like methyltransferase-domain-containing protein [Phakopsora pachyrhizi]|uniref:rRNA methyltransferase 2, mitochondrial n=1 Tax=Phakopsora pachyrhizi TaxID=170000 RepID=A0AAV0BPT9_PHAPC|nr:FtsJ-like methyltransferase-domain-containing protein [Phakopsora pachyrhizi]CAH7689360.1 FtsJ-like methyltransferase-domain-containing protein [Phakopsora pachyrhizi]
MIRNLIIRNISSKSINQVSNQKTSILGNQHLQKDTSQLKKGFTTTRQNEGTSGSKKTSSSKRFIRRSQTDFYGKIRTTERSERVYIARSAHKLIQIDRRFRIFEPDNNLSGGKVKSKRFVRVIELGGSPGGWTEVLIDRLERFHRSLLITCDLSPLHPRIINSFRTNTEEPRDEESFRRSKGRYFFQGDFNSSLIRDQIKRALDQGELDRGDERRLTVVLSDMLGDVSGIETRDSQESYELCANVNSLMASILSRRNDQSSCGTEDPGVMVIKHLQSDLTRELIDELRKAWRRVRWYKPEASRSESREGYFYCTGFRNFSNDSSR